MSVFQFTENENHLLIQSYETFTTSFFHGKQNKIFTVQQNVKAAWQVNTMPIHLTENNSMNILQNISFSVP